MIRIVAAALAALGVCVLAYRSGAPSTVAFDGTVQARHIPAIAYSDDRNRPVRLDAPAHGALIVLGYTKCAGACPLTLAKISAAVHLLRHETPPAIYFVTVDPVNDDAATLHRYLRAWGNRIVGITGDVASLRRLYVALDAGESRDARDHDTRLFAIDDRGEVQQEIPADAQPVDIARAMRGLSLVPQAPAHAHLDL